MNSAVVITPFTNAIHEPAQARTIRSWRTKRCTKSHSEKLLVFESPCEREDWVFRNMVPGRLTIFEWKVTYPRVNVHHK